MCVCFFVSPNPLALRLRLSSSSQDGADCSTQKAKSDCNSVDYGRRNTSINCIIKGENNPLIFSHRGPGTVQVVVVVVVLVAERTSVCAVA